MKWPSLIQSVLGVSGGVALVIGGAILLAPVSFYQSYQIVLPDSVELRSELRATATLLLLAAMVILAGALSAAHRTRALWVAIGFYGAFVFGRLISALFDGAPSSALTAAWAVELGLLTLNLMGVMAARRAATTPQPRT
ncbi:DUF4345 domain-containing protein [Saccharospirillum sp. HFRX-1]|uniref:DUF4345 domain-containing protein n=1 Tax=unclassified Saccharospirillum TaxID=2633430 RepID=UPI003719BD65